MRRWLPELIAFPVLPFLVWQGRRTRRITPRLPEAVGPVTGLALSPAPAGNVDRPFRLLTVGESPVAGVGVDTHEQAITGQLARALAEQLRRPVRWQACGRNGVTVREALSAVVPAIPAAPVDLALIVFGVNDTISFRSVSRWRADMQDLLAAVRNRSTPRLLILCGVPPVGRFPALPQPLRAIMGLKAAALDAALRDLATDLEDTLYVPLSLDPRRAEFMAHDGYHPSAIGCTAWAQALADACRARLADHAA